MSQLLPVCSQRRFLRDALNSLARTGAEQAAPVASSLIEDCLVALALAEMCHLATPSQAGERRYGNLLAQALEDMERQLYPLQTGDWSSYWRQVSETLEQPARQLETLQSRLLAIQQNDLLPTHQLVEGSVPFELLHLPAVAVLVAVPVHEEGYIDLERVQAQEGWRVSGAFYPFEVQVKELTFVVTSAGEIVVSIRNFPESLVRQARETLCAVAQTLYTVSPPPFTATIPEPEGGGDFPFDDEME